MPRARSGRPTFSEATAPTTIISARHITPKTARRCAAVSSLYRKDAQLRATLVGSQLVGLAMVRYIVRIDPLASASPETLAAALAPTLQRYLTEKLDLPASRPARSP